LQTAEGAQGGVEQIDTALQCPGVFSMMDLETTAKQIRDVLTLLLEGGFVMPIILTSIDRYGSLMVAEYTASSLR